MVSVVFSANGDVETAELKTEASESYDLASVRFSFMLMVAESLISRHQCLMAMMLLGFTSAVCAAGPRNINDDLMVESELQELPTAHIHQTLDGKISGEDRQRLRRDLDQYSRGLDAAHAQIEERRRLMRQRIIERFQEADKDGNGMITREEAMEMLPQVARHFTQFDLNDDGMITMNELETMQSRIAEQQHQALDKKEKELKGITEGPSPIHVKDVNTVTPKRAL